MAWANSFWVEMKQKDNFTRRHKGKEKPEPAKQQFNALRLLSFSSLRLCVESLVSFSINLSCTAPTASYRVGYYFPFRPFNPLLLIS
jgi:hypothetical protein